MFLISAATAMAAIMATLLACTVVVDNEQRIREEKISDGRFKLWVKRDQFSGALVGGLKRLLRWPWRANQSGGGQNQ
jgi:hypothetical protein